MTEQKRKFSFFTSAKKVFTSRPIRTLILLGLLITAGFVALTLDEHNYIREDFFPFLNNGFTTWLMGLFKIERIVIYKNSWALFACLLAVGFTVLILDVIKPLFNHIFYGRSTDEVQNKKKNRKFNAIYCIISLIIIAGVIAVIFLTAHIKTDAKNLSEFGDLLVLSLLFSGITLINILATLLIVKGLILFVSYLASRISKKSKEYKTQLDKNDDALNDYDKIFPTLAKIDRSTIEEKTTSTDIGLDELALRFQSYAINNHKIYYELPLLRSFIAGMAASRLIILEGLSGTGKSMLPRMFSQFTSSTASFTPVQATWRDKTDILGFYSEFTKSFKSTDFLTNLYKASYSDKINTMVLDEINLSRIEYYFADFLSILEYPAEDWKIKIFEAQNNQALPKKLDGGYVTIPENTWFVGTANTDDSTFTITDKVYDRAIIIDFAEKFSPIKSDYPSAPITLSSEKLVSMLKEASLNPQYQLNDKDLDGFIRICDFTKNAFDIRFGNRIMVQIEEFVPVYVALGGTKEEALDFMFARKILRKLHGAYEDYVKDELIKLTKLINEIYGKGVFKETERLISKIIKRLV